MTNQSFGRTVMFAVCSLACGIASAEGHAVADADVQLTVQCDSYLGRILNGRDDMTKFAKEAPGGQADSQLKAAVDADGTYAQILANCAKKLGPLYVYAAVMKPGVKIKRASLAIPYRMTAEQCAGLEDRIAAYAESGKEYASGSRAKDFHAAQQVKYWEGRGKQLEAFRAYCKDRTE